MYQQQIYELLNTYNPNSPISELANRVSALERKEGSTVWFNHVTGNWHLDETNSIVPHEDIWKGPVIGNYNDYVRTSGSKLKGGSALSATDIDQIAFNHIRDEFKPRFIELFDLWNDLQTTGRTKAAGVITMTSHPEIANQIVSQEMLDLTVRDFSLEGNATTTKTTERIEVPLPDRITGTLWSTGLGELEITDTVNISYAAATTKLQKAQVHVANTIWVNMVERRHDVVADTLRQARAEEPRVMEDEIANTLPGFADLAAGTAYDVIAAGDYHHTKDPTVDFFSVQNTVAGVGGQTNIVAMSPKTLQVLTSNTWMSQAGPLQTAQNVVSSSSTDSRVLTHPKLQGYTIVVSRKLPDGKIFDYDKRTVWSITGPQRTGTYAKDPGYIQGTILDKWYGVAIVEATLGKELTGTVT